MNLGREGDPREPALDIRGEIYEQSFDWIEKHGIFEAGTMGDGAYDKATVAFGRI